MIKFVHRVPGGFGWSKGYAGHVSVKTVATIEEADQFDSEAQANEWADHVVDGHDYVEVVKVHVREPYDEE